MAADTHRVMKYTPRSRGQAAAWQKDLRARLFRILRLDDLAARSTPIPLQPTVLSTEEKEGCIFQELQISTTPNRRIHVLVSLPSDREGRCPAVVCIHGHGGNRHIVHNPESPYRGFATALARTGCVTIATDVGRHEVYEENRILMGERLWDLMRCVDYLESLPQVDASRIGCAGLSLGGEMAMWLGAMDERMAATVSSGFLTTMDQMEQNHCMCWKFEGLRELVDYADIYSLIAPRPLQCQNGLKEGDTQFCVPLARKAMQEVEIIYGDLDRPGHVELDVHEGGHEIDLPALLQFIEKHLLG